MQFVSSFDELVALSFEGTMNAINWKRDLPGNFEEIVCKFDSSEGVLEIKEEDLIQLELTETGALARSTILQDFESLRNIGAAPVLNIITTYSRDDFFFPTDVYSFHVDKSPVPTHTFLCTYFGTSSEIIPNENAVQKILLPDVRAELKKLHEGLDQEFDDFLADYFFDLHYDALDDKKVKTVGVGNLCKLAVDHPEQKVLPCIHRAPLERAGERRLLMIC